MSSSSYVYLAIDVLDAAIDGESKVAVPEMVSRSKVVMEPVLLASLTELMGPDHGNLPPDAA